MIRSFADEIALDLFRERNTRYSRRLPRNLRRVTQRKLKALDVAARLNDLRIPAGNRLKRLRGDRSEQYSMRINNQYRVTFQWKDGDAHNVGIEDYH